MSMILDPNAPNVAAKKKRKKVRYRFTGRKGQVIVVACASAAGQVLPPTILFDAKKVWHTWTSTDVVTKAG